MKIPFDIKYRPQIESGEYKVETRDGITARIICWDRRGERPLVVLVQNLNGYDEGLFYYENGLANGVGQESDGDLFIVIPEPELTEFEADVMAILFEFVEEVDANDVKRISKELLELAKQELCKGCAANMEGYMKGRQDALKEMEKNRVYKHEGPTIPAPAPVPVFWPPCHYGGECTNPFHDCINCHRQSTDGISTTTGTSTAKVESHE